MLKMMFDFMDRMRPKDVIEGMTDEEQTANVF